MGHGIGVRVNIMLTGDVRRLINRAIAGGRYSGGASEYVRALIVEERKRAGDPEAMGVKVKNPRGKRRAA